jgi:hypothetical protein
VPQLQVGVNAAEQQTTIVRTQMVKSYENSLCAAQTALALDSLGEPENYVSGSYAMPLLTEGGEPGHVTSSINETVRHRYS